MSLAWKGAGLDLLKGDNNFVAFKVPKSQPFDVDRIAISDGIQWSNLISVNNPRAMHFDKAEIASGDTFRIFGRNLMWRRVRLR